jgi:hypothetical protein
VVQRHERTQPALDRTRHDAPVVLDLGTRELSIHTRAAALLPARDELFIAILTERDAVDRATFDPDGFAAVAAHSAQTPGLVRLFLEMAAAAPDAEHAAHGFFSRRYRQLREIVAS